ncbi:hypothetical protein JCM11641_005408 [Rhodosporidiobolus odoratus]
MVFVRDFSGHSVQLDATTVPSLRLAISQRLSIPSEEQRLSYGSRTLEGTDSLSSYGILEHGTVSLSLRLRGGAPKKRCGCWLSATERCSQAVVRIVGDCKLCSASFCARHRLAEDHTCPNLADCKEKAFQLNKTKLEAEQTMSEKLARV